MLMLTDAAKTVTLPNPAFLCAFEAFARVPLVMMCVDDDEWKIKTVI